MLKLRNLLCKSFGLLAALFSLVAYLQISEFVQHVRSRGFLPPATGLQISPSLILFKVALWVLADLVHLMPLILAILYGMAWWSVRRKKPSGRGWALAASIAMVLQVIPFSVAVGAMLRYRAPTGLIIKMAWFSAALIAPGVAGIIAFAAKDSLDSPEIGPTARPPRIAGDGTSKLLDMAIWAFAVAGYYLGETMWYRWGHAHHLSGTHGFQFWALFAVAMLAETTAHESGHALVGMAMGMQLRAFIVWPFQWVRHHHQWRFQIQLEKIFNFGGATGLVPTDSRQPPSAYIAMIAAGPLASLLVGCIAFLLARKVPGTEIEWTREFFSLVSTFGLVAFVVNLIPARPQGLYTDGAQIYQLLAGGPWADYHRAVSEASSGTVTPLRPRDYDIEAIRRASAGITQGRDGLFLRLVAYSHFADADQIPDACRALAEAESIYESSGIDSAEVCSLFVIGNGFRAQDSAAARMWWDRMDGKNINQSDNELYWMAKCTLEMGEGDLEAASEAWEKGNAIAQRRPRAGSYECNRKCLAELYDAIQGKVRQEYAVESTG